MADKSKKNLADMITQRGGLAMPMANDPVKDDPRRMKIPADLSDPIDQAQGGMVGAPPQSDPSQPQVGQFSNDPTNVDKAGAMMSGNTLLGSPIYQQILQNQQKLIALKAQPTYVNKRGETVAGMKDEDGRWQSGLKGLVAGLAENFSSPVRDMNDFYARLSGGISRGVGGAIVPEWNEHAERQREIQRLEAETGDMGKMAEFNSKMMSQDATRQNQSRRTDIAQGQLDERQNRNSFLKIKDEQKMLLEPIFKRGYFYEDDTDPATLQKLQSLGITLADFDNRHKPRQVNGQWEQYNPATRSYEPTQGLPVDPDEVPMTFNIDGQQITGSVKQFVGYAAAKERQQSQQTFQAGENTKTREVQWARIKQSAEQFKAKSGSEYAAKILSISEAEDEGSISPEEAAELKTALKRNNPDFQ